jgi:hypothetical protein
MVKKPKQPAETAELKSKSTPSWVTRLIRAGSRSLSSPPRRVLYFFGEVVPESSQPAGGVFIRFRTRSVLLVSDFSKQPAFHLPWRMASECFT